MCGSLTRHPERTSNRRVASECARACHGEISTIRDVRRCVQRASGDITSIRDTVRCRGSRYTKRTTDRGVTGIGERARVV